MKPEFIILAAIVSAIFGLITLFVGSSVIFDLFGIRERQGNYILFVVCANFICGFLYLIAAYGFWKNKSWIYKILGLSVWILLITFVGLMIWISNGKLYETKTIVAMTFRTIITIALWWIAWSMMRRSQSKSLK